MREDDVVLDAAAGHRALDQPVVAHGEHRALGPGRAAPGPDDGDQQHAPPAVQPLGAALQNFEIDAVHCASPRLRWIEDVILRRSAPAGTSWPRRRIHAPFQPPPRRKYSSNRSRNRRVAAASCPARKIVTRCRARRSAPSRRSGSGSSRMRQPCPGSTGRTSAPVDRERGAGHGRRQAAQELVARDRHVLGQRQDLGGRHRAFSHRRSAARSRARRRRRAARVARSPGGTKTPLTSTRWQSFGGRLCCRDDVGDRGARGELELAAGACGAPPPAGSRRATRRASA